MAEILINGPEGRLEGRYHQSEKKNAPAAIVLHPHPLHGGTMNNKVTYHIYHAFARNGFSVLRFNFRGVGKSQGVFDHGIGELSDAASALDWLQLQNENASSFWMGGFSFGSWIGMQLLMRRPEIEGFISVSPPAGNCDFNFLSPCPAHGAIIQGDKDSIVDESDVSKLVNKLSRQKNAGIDYRVILGADHFYRNYLEDLNFHMDEYIKNRLKNDATKPKRVKPDRRRRQTISVQPL
ncbi:alpha/beta hydrolase [Rickettsiales bacterium]|nr:alpha/beta hydrolase [Rickettsiales bacterium]